MLKNALKSLIFNKAKFSFYFILFLLKKNHKRKLIILKNYIKKNKKKRKKKKPLIKLSYFKLLKKITSYNNQTLQKNYDSDWTNDLIIRFNFLIRFKKLNLIINNNLTNLIKFNLLKFIKV